MRRQRLFALMSLVLSVLGVLLAAEVLLRCFYPQESMFPRWQFSPRYCTQLYENTTMLHERPGRWRFRYTTNEYQYRGQAVPISNVYERRNIVVLGDSYTFGHGVNDGEEYPAILAGKLKEGFDVVNLGVGGWGLTQEIRRFYEFGVLYRPRAVVLQFSANDPRDDLVCPVT